ncbi:MAG: hypothetical protein NUK65_06860 [Firmicutes bacterium]|nr:hypothetical protein [Bacillota bacterium]
MQLGETFKKSLLGEEKNLPVGVLPGKRPIHVFYTYYVSKPRSHRLEFKKENCVIFEIYLPNYGESLMQLCALPESVDTSKNDCDVTLGFWLRLLLIVTAGRLVLCREILAGPTTKYKTGHAEARSVYRYRVAYCAKNEKNSIVFIASRHSSKSSAFRKGKRIELKWMQMSLPSFELLIKYLRVFMRSTEFKDVHS